MPAQGNEACSCVILIPELPTHPISPYSPPTLMPTSATNPSSFFLFWHKHQLHYFLCKLYHQFSKNTYQHSTREESRMGGCGWVWLKRWDWRLCICVRAQSRTAGPNQGAIRWLQVPQNIGCLLEWIQCPLKGHQSIFLLPTAAVTTKFMSSPQKPKMK